MRGKKEEKRGVYIPLLCLDDTARTMRAARTKASCSSAHPPNRPASPTTLAPI